MCELSADDSQTQFAVVCKREQFRFGTEDKIPREWREKGERTLQPGLGAGYSLSSLPSHNLNVGINEMRWPAELGERDSAMGPDGQRRSFRSRIGMDLRGEVPWRWYVRIAIANTFIARSVEAYSNCQC